MCNIPTAFSMLQWSQELLTFECFLVDPVQVEWGQMKRLKGAPGLKGAKTNEKMRRLSLAMNTIMY